MYTSNYSYYPGFGAIPGQPGGQPAPPEANGSGAPWDNAAAGGFYQPGWAGYYSTSTSALEPRPKADNAHADHDAHTPQPTPPNGPQA